MILVDTSVWIEHFRKGVPRLHDFLKKNMVLCHSHVIVELACGNLRNRRETLVLLSALPSAIMAEDQEFLDFIGTNGIMGRGIGFVDAHLLASSRLSNTRIWTLDKALLKEAERMDLVYTEE